jgi:uncharacterized protein YcbK (DUF882 family)
VTRVSAKRLKHVGIKGFTALVLASAAFLIGSQGLQTATANGDTRTLSFFHTHSRESITVTFKRNGRYDADGLRQLNHFLRDWRNQDEIKMDPRLFDLAWEVYRESGGRQPINIVSSYRSPKTNAMLRSRSKAVAEHSQHTLGKAMDFRIPDVGGAKIRAIGLRLQRGGVGYYPSSDSYFVHIDTGSVRHWPRMSRSQLAQVFPDGRTVHIPTDGKPMPGYQLALADLQRSGASVNSRFASAGSSGSGKGLFARLFNSGEDEGEETAAPATRIARAETIPTPPPVVEAVAPALPAPAPAAAVIPPVAPEPEPVLASAAAIPMPRPAAYAAAAELQVASLGAGPRMIWKPGADASTAAAATVAPALPFPRPGSHTAVAAAEPVTETSLVTAYASEVPLPLRSPFHGRMALTTTPAVDVERTAVATPRSAPTPVRTASVAPKAELVTVKMDDTSIRNALEPERVSRGAANSRLAHPDQIALASLIAHPSSTLGQTFGGNPTGGLRSDAFQGRAVALIRTVHVDVPQPAQAVAQRGG